MTDSSVVCFPDGLLQEIFDQLSLTDRVFFLLTWASPPEPTQHPLSEVGELFSTLSRLDLSHYSYFEPQTFKLLENLPLTNLVELDLTASPFSDRPAFDYTPPDHGPEITSVISSCPYFNNLRTLKLSNCRLTSVDCLLAGANSFPHLTYLDLSKNSHLDILPLTKTPKMSALKTLIIKGISIQHEQAKAFADPSNCITFKLEKLDIGSAYSLPDESFDELFKSPHLTELRWLSTCGAEISSEPLQVLMKEGKMTKLESLDVSFTYFFDGEGGLASIAQSPLAANLKELGLGGCEIGDEGLQELVESNALTKLEKLTLFGHQQQFTTLEPLWSNLPCKLKSLDLANITLSLSELKLIGSAPCLSELEELNFQEATFEDQGEDENEDENEDEESQNGETEMQDSPLTPLDKAIRIIAKSPNFSKLKRLNLGSVDFSANEQSIQIFLSSPTLSNDLVELNLSNSQVGDANIDLLVSKFPNLQVLKLQGCGIGAAGVELIATRLPALSKLLLSRNPEIDDNAFCSILSDDLSTPQTLSNLVHLSLAECSLGNATLEKLAKSQLLDTLEYLSLKQDTHMTEPSIVALINSPRVSRLKHLALSRVNLSIALTKALDSRKTCPPSLRHCELKFYCSDD